MWLNELENILNVVIILAGIAKLVEIFHKPIGMPEGDIVEEIESQI
jgi:hypothetical protein